MSINSMRDQARIGPLNALALRLFEMGLLWDQRLN